MSGRQSTSIALLDAARLGRRALLDPPPRPGAPVRQAGRRGARPSSSCRPRSTRPSASRSPARWPPRAPTRLMASATSGPAGRSARRRCWPRARADGASPSRCPRSTTRSWPSTDGASTARSCRSRTRWRARSTPTLDALAVEARDVAIVGEAVHPIRHCLIAARRSSSTTSPPCSRTRSRRPVRRASCASALRGAEVRRRAVDRRRRAHGRRARAPWAALGTALAAELYGCEVLRRGHRGRPRQRDALRLAGAGGRRRAAPATGRGRRRSCSPAPATRRPGGWCAACRSSPSAASTSRASSRGRCGRASGTTSSTSTRRRVATRRRSRRDRGPASALRGDPPARLLAIRRPERTAPASI